MVLDGIFLNGEFVEVNNGKMWSLYEIALKSLRFIITINLL